MGACQSSGNVSDILSNSKSNDDSVRRVTDMVTQHSSTNDVDVNVHQNVNIEYLGDRGQDLIGLKCTKYFLGFNLGQYDSYGASYDISQTFVSKITTLNKDISNQSIDIFNKVSSKIKSDLHAKLGSTKDQKTINNAVNSTKDDSINKIREHLENELTKDVNENQGVNIVAHTPIRFAGECGDKLQPKITQNAYVTILANDLVNIVRSNIQKNITDSDLQSKLDIDSTSGDTTCQEELFIGIIACIICLGFFYFLYTQYSKKGGKKASNNTANIGSSMSSIPISSNDLVSLTGRETVNSL